MKIGKAISRKGKVLTNYDIYEDGRIYSRHSNKFLKQPISAQEYHFVNLYHKRRPHVETVHGLVARAFIGPSLGRHIHHKDFNKLNNNVSNLEYVTCKENLAHSFAVGDHGVLLNPPAPVVAYKEGFTQEYESRVAAARDLNLHQGNIWKVLRGERKHTKGYKFKYV